MPNMPNTPEIISLRRIWGDEAPHNAFGDIIRFNDRWFCAFREGKGHSANAECWPDNGALRVITSEDGKTWHSAARLVEEGIDLQDPHLSVTADSRLMIVAGGSTFHEGTYVNRQPRVAFSSDGQTWSQPRKVLNTGHWLWRVDWHDGRAYGVSKYGKDLVNPNRDRRQSLVKSTDGLQWESISELNVPHGDETTVRFRDDGSIVALVRRAKADGPAWIALNAWIGHSRPPYRQWSFHDCGHFVGGPNFIILPSGAMWAGGRYFPGGFTGEPGQTRSTVLARMTLEKYEPVLQLPSGGDCSYPGFVWHDGLLWTMYYSSHEENTAIYLAQIRV